jgi:hypothetical protein
MSALARTQERIYLALAEFNETAQWNSLRLPQMRQYLAEHLANALVPESDRDPQAKTAHDEIAHVLLMRGLFPADWRDAYRVEVFAEVTTWLVKKAREFRSVGTRKAEAQANAVAAMASKISRGAVRPDNLRMLPDAGFFEVDHTYRSGRTTFRCEYLSSHPTSGEPRAIGWVLQDGHDDEIRALDADDFALCGWADVTEAGEPA